MLKKRKTGHMTCRNERAICRFKGGSSGNDVNTTDGSKEDTSRTGNNSAMNINTPSCPSLISSLPKNSNSIHAYRLSTVPSPGRATTEHGALEREEGQGPTTQSTTGVSQGKVIRFSRVCEVITFGEKIDEVRLHLFHYFPNRLKEVHPVVEDEDVDRYKETPKQKQDESGQTKSNGRC